MDIPDFKSEEFSITSHRLRYGNKIYKITHRGNEWEVGQDTMDRLFSFTPSASGAIGAMLIRLKEHMVSITQQGQAETIIVNKSAAAKFLRTVAIYLKARYFPLSRRWIDDEKQRLYQEIDHHLSDTLIRFPEESIYALARLSKDLWSRANVFDIEAEVVEELEVGAMYWLEYPYQINIAKLRHKSPTHYWFTNHGTGITKIPRSNTKVRFFKLKELA